MDTPDDSPRNPSLTARRWVRESLLSAVSPLWFVAVAVSLLLLSPVAWIVLRAAEVDLSRALSLLTRQETVEITLNSLTLVTVVTVASILLGVPLAYLTVQTDLPFRRFWTVVAALPLVIPSYIGAFAYVSAFGPRGALSDLLAPLGIPDLPVLYGLPGAALVITLFTYPYVFLTTRASLQSLDGRAVEAARTLNHGRWGAFRRVTLPQIAPGIGAGALLTALYALSDFGTPQIMRYDVFTRIIYMEQVNAFNPEYAAVLSVVLLGLTLLILGGESRLNASREGAHVSSGGRRPGRVELGAWRWPALGFCGLVAAFGLVLPVGILVRWLFVTTPGYFGGGSEFQWGYAVDSVLIAGGAALLAVLTALPLAYLSVRSDSWLARLPGRSTFVGYAMPGVVVGLSLVFVGLRFGGVFYGTIFVLLFAYVVRFIPQAVGTIETSIQQVDPEHVEAARTMGESPLRSFARVELPQITPGVLAGAALVFLTTMKELPATLMLKPFWLDNTLVTYIWEVQEAGNYGQAAVPALVLVGVSALSLLLIIGRDRYDVSQ